MLPLTLKSACYVKKFTVKDGELYALLQCDVSWLLVCLIFL